MAVYRGAERALERQRVRLVMAEWNGVWFPDQGWSFGDFTEYFERFGYRPIEPQRATIGSYESGEYDANGRVVNIVFERS